MPVFFVIGIGSLLLAFVDLVLGAWLAAVCALAFWTISVLLLGNGIDWNRRLVTSTAYCAMILAGVFSVAGVFHKL